MAMGDEEEWQVAGHGRHRRCRRDDAKPNKIGSALLRNVHTTHAYTSTTVNFKRAGRRTSVERETGYVYQQTMRAKSARNGTRRILIEERVQEEVRKVKHLAVLLRRTALWASLVEKLETALSTLKIGFVGQPLSLGASLSYSPGTASNGEHRCNTHSWTSPTHAGHHPAETVVGTSREDRRGRTKRGDKGAECRRRMRPARRSSDTDPCILEQDGTAGVLSPSTDRLRCRTEEARTCGSSTRIEATEQDLCKCSTNRLFELVCYGIGNFSDSNTARYQLALALCLRERLFPPGLDSSNNVDPGPVTDLHLEPGDGRQVLAVKTQSLQPVGEKTKNAFQRPVMLVFDPVMGEVETKVLAALGCGVIEINEQGKRGCSEPCAAAGGASDGYSGERMEVRCRPTLFFMPHCPMRLYSNLLWANWSCQGKGGELRWHKCGIIVRILLPDTLVSP